MVNTWLYVLAKHAPFLQTRLLSGSSYYLQGHCNVLSADASCISPKNNATIFRSESNPGIGILETEQNSKCDLLTSLCWPVGARNHELINSLRKIIHPMRCDESIHVSKTADNAKNSETKTFNKTTLECMFSGLNNLDEPSNRGDLLLMQSQDAQTSSDSNGIMKCSSDSEGSSASGGNNDDKRKGPTVAQLEDIRDYYIRIIPHIMGQGEKFNEGKHDKNIIFENHLRKRPKTTVGLTKYAMELSKIRLWSAFMYQACAIQIRTINIDPVNGYVKIHWVATTSSTSQVWKMFFYLLTPKNNNQAPEKLSQEFEAISTVYVSKEGKIIKHVVDRRIPLEDEQMSTVKNFAVKTAGMVGLAPKNSFQKTKDTIS